MSKAIKVVAAIEALKGTISLVAAVAAWSFAHTNLQTLITALAEHLHLNPAAKYPHIFVLALDNLHNTRMMTLALGAAAYTVLRFIEAFGLYRERSWAEILAACSGAIYVPFEIAECIKHPGILSFSLLIANLAVVAIMVNALFRRRLAIRFRRETSNP